MNQLAEAWKTRLEEDLAGFADRKSLLAVEVEGTTLRAGWTARGRQESELFGVTAEGSLRWLSGPTEQESYPEFLMSEGMADFDQFASAIGREVTRERAFVASDADVDRGFDRGSSVRATPGALAELVDHGRAQAEGRTSLFFLKGDPGAGKTTLLRETTALQAERYMQGESGFLLFYVSAQGRELGNLRDAFSGELDDLRAGFTRDAVAALARSGLLIPVVDGFDELLGTAGYSGAFSSLQTLLGELDGLGAVVVSARSAFYDLELLGRSTSPASEADIGVTTIGLEPWTDAQLETFMRKTGGGVDRERVGRALETLSAEDRRLLRRPFFASRFPEFAAEADGHNVDLLEYLISAYLEREARKIVDSSGEPVLPVDGHRRLFELAAEHMWEAEARQLAVDELRTFTEIVAEEFVLGADEASQLGTKVTSYAGFRPGRAGGRDDFAFEHEVYFDYFLARAVQRLLRESNHEDLASFFDRGVVPEGVALRAVDVLGDGPLEPELLHSSTGVRFDNRRRNLGTLLAARARKTPLTECTLQNLLFTDIGFHGAQFDRVRFENCLFIGVDLAGARFQRCVADGSTFQGLKLDNESQLDIRGLRAGQNVGSIFHVDAGDIYAPKDVEEVLRRRGVPRDVSDEGAPEIAYSPEAENLINLLAFLARAYRRTNIVYESDEFLHNVFGSGRWPALKQLLVEHRVVTEETRSTSGRPTNALRLRVRVDDLLTGQTSPELPNTPAGELWRELRTL